MTTMRIAARDDVVEKPRQGVEALVEDACGFAVSARVRKASHAPADPLAEVDVVEVRVGDDGDGRRQPSALAHRSTAATGRSASIRRDPARARRAASTSIGFGVSNHSSWRKRAPAAHVGERASRRRIMVRHLHVQEQRHQRHGAAAAAAAVHQHVAAARDGDRWPSREAAARRRRAAGRSRRASSSRDCPARRSARACSSARRRCRRAGAAVRDRGTARWRSSGRGSRRSSPPW